MVKLNKDEAEMSLTRKKWNKILGEISSIVVVVFSGRNVYVASLIYPAPAPSTSSVTR